MAKRYVCKGCGKRCSGDISHKCEESCSDCMFVPPCAFSGVRIPCESCNRTFRSQTCFNKHKTNMFGGKAVCSKKRNCANSKLLTRKKHECFKPYCTNCKQNSRIGNLCYMYPLQNVLPRSGDVFLSFMILKPRRIQTFQIRQQCTFQIWSAFNISVPFVRLKLK
jgi:hypothetical protein